MIGLLLDAVGHAEIDHLQELNLNPLDRTVGIVGHFDSDLCKVAVAIGLFGQPELTRG
jgi:hypothetical protein